VKNRTNWIMKIKRSRRLRTRIWNWIQQDSTSIVPGASVGAGNRTYLRKWPTSGHLFGLAVVSLLGGLVLWAQAAKPAQQPAKSATPQNAASQATPSKSAVAPQNSAGSQTAAAQPNPLPPLPLDGDAILHNLNQVISWYRHATTGVQSVGLPSDTIYQDNAKNLGEQAVRLAFQSARAETAMIAAQQKAAGKQVSNENTQQQNLQQLEQKTSAQIDSLQGQITTLNDQIPRSSYAKRRTLTSQRDALEGELELQKSLLDAIQKMATFAETNGEISGGLEGEVNQLARSIPEVLGSSATAQKNAATPTSSSAKPSLANSGGLISEVMTLYDYVSTMHQIDDAVRDAEETRDVADQLRAPLRAAMRATMQQSQELANHPPVTDPQQLQLQRETFQALTQRFKRLADVLLPLSQEMIVLNDAKTNFGQWRDSIRRESKYALRSVLLRVIAIAIALAVILFLSEIWRRITFRYIGDPRRRRQFLVMRRVVIGFLVVVVLTLGFVSEFSSLATFAGFITAGVAVGLQALLLSVAAYFFIIGRYGIRVGDRISVAGVTGDVVDIGLVRIYMMELAGTGLDLYPTGRIVVFSNSVLFQAGTPLFKQIPGTEYSWHEVVVNVAPSGNHQVAQKKLVAAVDEVYEKYRHRIEQQHAMIERRVDIQVATPKPEARLQFADNGLELLVRYPVDIRKAPDIDEEMTRRVLQLTESDAELKTAVAGTPKIRSAVKG
jgi:small-conductance mechanosensitive channel